MMPTLGFVLLVNPHSPLSQTERLIRTLNRMFDFPPIACHHDFGKSQEFIQNLPDNVKVVRPHVNTRWADFSCIEAAVKALRLLYSGEKTPDWFIYLSGADYPIKPAATILSDLAASPYDAHIEHLAVDKLTPTPSNPFHPEGYKGPHWLRYCHKLFCSRRLRVPWISRHLRLTSRAYWLEHPFFTTGQLPFSDTLRCFAGEAWFCANRKSAQAILGFYDTDTKLAPHYRKVLVPEESYFHTVLANAPGLKLSQDHLRYIDWTHGGSSPKILTSNDLPRMMATTAHFARKFAPAADPFILDRIDEVLGS
ncbi:MAG: beta-1,6-N-acetylglucosaminyltransferase [Chthoniobacterales bacterium]